jgi:deazaflavin-dependent oxidoreductase (nitroreductase family)
MRMKLKDTFYKVGTAIHRTVFRLSKGRIFGNTSAMSFIELVTIGRRSGKARARMLSVPIIDGDRLVLVASFGGDDRHPAWYLNLRSNPEVRVTIAGLTRTMFARIAQVREFKEMLYQFEAPFVLNSSKYARVFGDVEPTPYPEGIARTVRWHLSSRHNG